MKDILFDKLKEINRFEYLGKEFEFSNNNITQAMEDIDEALTDGLIKTNEKIYDHLILGKSYPEKIPNAEGTKSFNLNFIDWEHGNNVFHAVEEFSVQREDGKGTIRPDIVLFINGIPFAVIECKKSSISINQGISQMIRNQNKEYAPQLFKFIQIVMATNKNETKYATAGTPKKFWSVWKEDEEGNEYLWYKGELNKAVENRIATVQDKNIVSIFHPKRVVDIIKYFLLFDIKFINMMNEHYIKIVSNNTKYSLKLKQKEGKYVGSRAPFGYKKSDKDKHKLVICEESFLIVKKIFSLYSSGMPLKTVANEINTQYPSCKRKWNSYSIRNILENPIYTGDMVQNRTYCPNHKVKKRMPNPKEKWIVVPNTHKPIVEKNQFNIVQELLKKDIKPTRTYKNTNNQPSIFAGYLYCNECGKKLIRKSRTVNGKTTYYFICSTYKSHGKNACSTHYIREEVIHSILLEVINLHAYLFINEKELIKNLEQMQRDNNISDFTKSRKKKIENKLNELKAAIQGLYADYKKEIITLEEYMEFKQDFKEQYDELQSELLLVEEEIKNSYEKPLSLKETAKFYTDQKMFDKLDKSLIIHLADRIVVCEGKEIEIIFRYKNPFEVIN